MGRRTDLCTGTDFNGKNKNDAGKDHGTARLSGAVISAVGLYEPLMEYAGAGAGVPLLGYGNILMKGVKEAIDKDGFIGLFKGGFTNGAVGCSAALIFGYLASLIFKPKMKA